jgi:hypothetical protein
MAEFNFFGSWKDTIDILIQLLDSQPFRVIADIAYIEPLAYEVKSITDDTLNVLKRNHHIFLASESYARYPIKFSEPNKGGHIGVLQLESGPLMDMLLSDVYEANGKWRVGRGRIAYPPYFIIPNTNNAYKPPQKLKDAFALSKKIIQKNMTRRYWRWMVEVGKSGETRPTIETLWIGKDAIDLIETKEYLIKWGRDIWITASDLQRDPNNIL